MKCQQCGKEFKYARSNTQRKYCSRTCYLKARNKRSAINKKNKMSVDKNIRNLLLSQPETKFINDNSCTYMGKTYHYVPITVKGIKRITQKLINTAYKLI